MHASAFWSTITTITDNNLLLVSVNLQARDMKFFGSTAFFPYNGEITTIVI